MNASLHRRFDHALALIEQRLAEPLTLARIAAAAHLSPYHFARAFRAAANDSVMNYLRRRRLQHGVSLLRDAPERSVLDIALACGFGSNEAFTRAFQRQYGIAPSTYRRNAEHLHLPIHRRLVMSDLAWTAPPPPIYVELDAFLALGMADEFLPGQGTQIGALWSRFVPRIGEITGRVGTHTYGICCPLEDVRECDRFSYVAAVQVRSLAAIPDGMTGVSMPASRCAVFSHTLGLGPALQQTMRYIFGEWLPASGHESAAPDFEYYDDRFDPATGTGELLIYVPIARS